MVAAPARRTQAQRRAVTQARLLEATIECLAELGYAGTTTTEVARRAGLSRGAQLHHFGTKAELVSAAMEHLHLRLVEEFRTAMASLPPGADPLDASIDVIWEMYSTPLLLAWMELSLAARNDEELRAGMAEADRVFMVRARAAFAEAFPQASADADYSSLAPLFTFAVLDGLALRRLVVRDEGEEAMVLGALKAIAHLMAPPTAPAEEGT